MTGGQESAQADTLTIEGEIAAPAKPVLDGQFASDIDPSKYAAFAKTPAKVEGDSLNAVRALAQELVGCERALAAAMAEVVKAKNNLADVAERRLPDMMEAAELPLFKFVDRLTGVERTIELIKDKWAVSLPALTGKNADPQAQMKRDAVYEWLESDEVGQSAVIKRDMEVPLGLCGDEKAAEICLAFKQANPDLDVALKKYVEPMTLKSIVEKMKKEGKNVNEYINAKPIREAKVKSK